ncbi:hypothetical protein M970_041220 [Encephalitozoon cuniculi EcunIII-L]|uniref:Uncharacterized protein n=1 Tax=Encephalitozoon cuniculi TaxID=6035 RepID=M1JIS1_ENCCN|nr:hypothetical protein ECU04_1270 [Encephalitozoon cuniculi]KMV66330.1 hypothetical protein M970_041220 [Encephalitozoon cuniculi EcunIII-L]UYI27509.1 hypothetical protein J0A71_06g13800 [Encephalitozoon cuniculi]
MGSGSSYPVSFESLEAFFEIVRNERYFKIQIITLESLEVFETALRDERIEYVRCFSSMIRESELPILILRDSDIHLPRPGRYILFSNKRCGGFVQIVFNPTLSEKLAIVGDMYVVQAYSYKNISELLKVASKEKDEMESYFGSGLDYFESVIMLVVRNRSRFRDILGGAKEMDDKLGNSFFLQMKLNGLVDKLFVVRNGDSYRVNVSEGVLRSIGERIGFDAGSGV